MLNNTIENVPAKRTERRRTVAADAPRQPDYA